MSSHEQMIKDFWDDQARKYSGQEATNEDTWYRSLEIKQIIKAMGADPGYVLDVGCGNGYSTKKFAARFPLSHFTGIDYSEQMIKDANENVSQNVLFLTKDVLNLNDLPYKYDTIISERCLINITNYEKQEQAIIQMRQRLATTGKMIIVENTMDGLNRLNRIRGKFGLHDIQVRWHNMYFLHELLLSFLQEHFEWVKSCNIGTPYYMLSRVLYAKFAQMRGIEPDYNNWMNRIACRLPTIPSWHASPNHMFVCSRKKP